ncbi:C-C motif chemokine 20-like [Solea senegalensis]|uniref:C-C motif chemokine 20-like n=2 Tax=Solea senegalensis TaxID=28829 RepID=A0AAV6T3R1_SOLSE|nr:C-C motif chemokine 20-like [Solea senegalensis]
MVSIKATVAVIAALTLCLMLSETSAVNRNCCNRYMKTKLPFSKIKGYSVQDHKEMCPINAIIFHTSKGKTCTDPTKEWVMDYVERLRNRAQKVHMNK